MNCFPITHKYKLVQETDLRMICKQLIHNQAKINFNTFTNKYMKTSLQINNQVYNSMFSTQQKYYTVCFNLNIIKKKKFPLGYFSEHADIRK